MLHRAALHDGAALVRRLGLLNVSNPFKCDVPFDLNLGNHDEREMAIMMIRLSVIEPGINFVFGQTLFNRHVSTLGIGPHHSLANSHSSSGS